MTTIIRGVKGARTGMVALEDLNDEQLAKLKHEFDCMHQRFDDEGDEGGDGGKGDTPPKQSRRRSSQKERSAQRAS
ncbi:MAG TPA: hypothetical protein VKC57_08080 [Ktedonobacterales bacterium]|nr:hypothetical protein [Ktedonobacterales bacterium]